MEVFNLRSKILINKGVNLPISNNVDNNTFIRFIKEVMFESDFCQFGIEFDWASEFVECIECIELEIKTDQAAANLESNLIEIDNLKVELNKIQNENKKKKTS